jgi:Co/Zn/Cd efflux system component
MAHVHDDEVQKVFAPSGVFAVSIFEDGVPPVFRITPATESSRPEASTVSVTTVRSDGAQQVFTLVDRGGYLESKEDIPEPHAFKAIVQMPDGEHEVEFEEHEHGNDTHDSATRDHNIRSAYIHVMADAAVSVLAIIGLVLARTFGWIRWRVSSERSSLQTGRMG